MEMMDSWIALVSATCLALSILWVEYEVCKWRINNIVDDFMEANARDWVEPR